MADTEPVKHAMTQVDVEEAKIVVLAIGREGRRDSIKDEQNGAPKTTRY